jgi:hypothetical protein
MTDKEKVLAKWPDAVSCPVEDALSEYVVVAEVDRTGMPGRYLSKATHSHRSAWADAARRIEEQG